MNRCVTLMIAGLTCVGGCAARAPGAGLATAARAAPHDGATVSVDPPAIPVAEVLRVGTERLAEVNRCHEQGLAVARDAGGTIVARFVVRADGAVATAEVARSSHPLAQTAACIIEAIRGWRFPRPAGGVDVTVVYPFTLHPAEPADPSGPPPSAEEAARLDALRPIAHRGDASALRDAVERYCADFPGSRHLYAARLDLAELHHAQRRFDAAREVYQTIVATEGVPVIVAGYARYKLAWTLHALDQHGAALAAFTDGLDVLASGRTDTVRALMRTMRAELAVFVGSSAATGSNAADALRLLRRYAADEAGAREMVAGLARWYREHQRADDAVALERAAAEPSPAASDRGRRAE